MDIEEVLVDSGFMGMRIKPTHPITLKLAAGDAAVVLCNLKEEVAKLNQREIIRKLKEMKEEVRAKKAKMK